MIRIGKLADYGIVLMTHFASAVPGTRFVARELALRTHVPAPTVSKLLKMLARAGLLHAERGVAGGFYLIEAPNQISVSEIIDAIEGPVAMTQCSAEPGACGLESHCPTQTNWKKINQTIRGALDQLTLAEMSQPLRQVPGQSRPAPNSILVTITKQA